MGKQASLGAAEPRPVSIITGAGSGIGRATALSLAALGHRLVLSGRDEAALNVTADAVASSDVAIVVGDVTRAETVSGLTATCLMRFGRLDVLVNNAGTARMLEIEKTEPGLLDEVFRVNTFAAALLTARAWPIFQKQGRGVLVHVSSMAAIDPFLGFFVYGASKAALESLSRSAAREGAKWNIESYAIRPGAVETPLLRRLFDERAIPSAGAMDPRVIADIVVECVIGKRRTDNGQTIDVPNREG